jgi:hypothetical protein
VQLGVMLDGRRLSRFVRDSSVQLGLEVTSMRADGRTTTDTALVATHRGRRSRTPS